MWEVKFCEEAKRDLRKLDNSIAKQVLAGIKKVSQNPLPQSEGGYGKPLGSHNATELTGFFKIKYRGIGIRVVYTIVRQKNVMNIIVVSLRADDESYKEAEKRKQKYGKEVHEDIF
ncbi:type II toxin-antitoxin system RelE family toxin [Fusibacter ferrireducens]|uniref:Type II toxin-antitoxin system RelE/ParE family toxin n=1 Tax=Fusibacter ferrireducens TaxID=2785058 RepID=A0ABS0A048_9FIRM|nr:type II toxin-antitoxin system RelE/ParE family toxin [Fusibacter ferrireducens]MBF4696065.1 type II toxin-antitoxin system RelE/ParE family toxin [Fusibacter ferrireducens]